MSDSIRYEAIRLLAQARVERERGRFDSALEPLNQIIAMGEKNEWFTQEYAYRAAHGELYKVYEAIGQSQDAVEYYNKALELGIKPEQLDQ